MEQVEVCKNCHKGVYGKAKLEISLALHLPGKPGLIERKEIYCMACAKLIEKKLKTAGLLKKPKENTGIKVK